MVARLPSKQAEAALAQLEAHTKELDVAEAGEAWDAHLSFQQALQERLGKARGVKSALRKPKTGGSTGKRAPKRRCAPFRLKAVRDSRRFTACHYALHQAQTRGLCTFQTIHVQARGGHDDQPIHQTGGLTIAH